MNPYGSQYKQLIKSTECAVLIHNASKNSIKPIFLTNTLY